MKDIPVLNDDERALLTQGLDALKASVTRLVATSKEDEVRTVYANKLVRISNLSNRILSKELF